MKIAWLQDYSRIGGAELTCKEVVRIGENLGHDIVGITPQDFKSELFSQCDVIIINNFYQFDSRQMKQVQYAIYEQRISYIIFEHDHRNLDRPDFARPLFTHSRLNIFLSPMHLANFHEKLGINGICLPLAINTDQYRQVSGIERIPYTALVCNVRNFKKWTNLQSYIKARPELNFTIIADQSPIFGNNVTLHQFVSPEKMSEVYSKYEYLVHILDGYGAGERVIFEAALCGCKIIANDHVGHISWKRNLEDIEALRSWLKQAPYEFWEKVKDAII